MKETIIEYDGLQDWDGLDDRTKRIAALEEPGTYQRDYLVISDLNGHGWYVGMYKVLPILTNSGKVILKTSCTHSCTFKDGKTYGDITENWLLYNLSSHVPCFNWIYSLRNSGSLPRYAVYEILSKRVTSEESLFKLIAKRSYKDCHWKVARWCWKHRVSMLQLKLACNNYEAVLQMPDIDDRFQQLLKEAIIAGTKIDCLWSSKRIDSELEKFHRDRIKEKLLSLPDEHVYGEPLTINGFRLIDSKRAAFETSELFSNCVYRSYWTKIEDRKYLVFANFEQMICIGYQIMEDGDVLLDQCRGKHNANVEDVQSVDQMLRPIAQQLASGDEGAICLLQELYK